MGIFDRFRSAGQTADAGNNKADTHEQDALRLIDAGQAHEANGRIDEATQCYLDAIRLAPNLARAHLNHGNALLAKGNLNGALDAFRTAIKHKPDYAGAYYNIGNAQLGYGQYNDAVSSYLKALEIKPDYAEVHCALGVALKELGQLDDALASYKRAIALNPDLVEAHSNLGLALNDLYNRGNALASKGQREKAVESYRQALEIKPDFAEAHCNQGLALQELGQLEVAMACYRRALEIKPDLAEAHSNLGSALQKLGEFENALASYRRAVNFKPDFAEAHSNLGFALQNIGQFEGAIASYRRALEIKPDYAEAHSNLGGALETLGQIDRAVECYRKALEIKPDLAEAHLNLGCALQGIRQYEGAVASFRQALEFKPDFAEAHSNLGAILRDLGQLDGAEACYRRALEIKPDLHQARSDLLFVLHYTASHTPSYSLGQAREFGRIVAGKAGARFSTWRCTDQPERLRVGLVSGDLRIHSVGHFLEGMLSHINPDRIELIAYPTHYKEDELTARIRPYFSAWKPLFGKNDEAAAHLIHADGVHVLLDISGHTGHNRLPMFAWKPATVQVTWLGLPATTGVAEMDYVLGDPYAIPTEFESHFSEAVWRMPESCLCLAVPASPVKVAPLPALSAGYVTFGSFNYLTKMTDEVVAVWARVLKSVPNSRLLLKTKQLSDQVVCEKTRQRFVSCGIAPDRLLLGGTLASRDDHLAEYNKVDIALDTFPYPGVTTSVEALWMGIPVLSLQGDRFLSRTAGSISHNAGLPDWIAADEDDYVAKAVAFASNLKHLAALRAGLRQQVTASPLFDAPRFARNFEDALWGMWQSYQAQ
ncbi:MAG: tetratricopeptide repeat protein [Gallionella sp.]|nr:tetratricopeptide repeat protein [Gallionella sp.]